MSRSQRVTALAISLISVWPVLRLSGAPQAPAHPRAAAPAAGRQGKTGAPKPRQCEPTPLDLDTQVLPRGFCPDDPEVVYTQRDKPKKNEFETADQYQARLDSRPSKPVYIFSSDTRGNYNADKQMFALNLGFDFCAQGYYRADCSVLGLVIKSRTKSSREYTAVNAFGAKAQVTRTDEEKYGLIFPRKEYHIDVSVPVEDARDAKDSLAVLVITGGHAATGDDVVYGIRVTTPTLSEPDGGTDTYYWVNLLVKSLWVYNKKTGNIYQKMDDIATK
jgi:hypothetical protein